MRFVVRDGTALITGAASGIGSALAHSLSGRGANLALVDRDAPGLFAVAAAARARGVRVSEHVLDVADRAALVALPDEVLAHHGQITMLVNNAGVAMAGRVDETTLDEFEWLFDIDFWATVRLTKACLPALAREPAAHVVNLSSLFGLVAPPGQAAYAAAKFAVRGFSESLRHELAGSTVSLTVVHPGGVRTRIAQRARIAEGVDAAAAHHQIRTFETLLRTDAADAAEQITMAIERRQLRLLIGGDARMADRLQRLLPSRYWSLMSRRVVKVARAKVGEAA